MRTLLFALGLLVTLASTSRSSTAWAVPLIGQSVPAFSVEDLNSAVHTERELTGRWTVVLAMSDKDAGAALRAWWLRVAPFAPAGTRVVTFAALDLFGLIPTATIVSEARGATPRARWSEVWLSRNGSLAESLGLPASETPFVFVVDAAGRVLESLHAMPDDGGVARVLSALRRASQIRETSRSP